MIILRVLVITNFRGEVVGRVSKWIIIKCRSFGKKGHQKWVIKSVVPFPSPRDRYEKLPEIIQGTMQALICKNLSTSYVSNWIFVVADLCPWRLSYCFPISITVPLHQMLLDLANGYTTNLGTQTRKGASLPFPYSPLLSISVSGGSTS